MVRFHHMEELNTLIHQIWGLIEVIQMKLAKEELKVELSKSRYNRARKWVLVEINGKACYEFNRLWDYANALRKEDPDGNMESTPSPAAATPAPLAPSDPTSPAPSKTVTSEAFALSPLAPSTQPNPLTMPTSSTQQILTRLRSRGKQVVKGIGLYTDEKTGMQILNPSIKGETMVTAPTKCTNKIKDKETTCGTQESRNTKKAKSKDPPKHNRKPWR
ncbi:hypothetical protein GOBAR_DD13324 [Gossypium barbadense]|nr:hypothetical protein GOBAR_DD13324 [Gossypium barbadense]